MLDETDVSIEREWFYGEQAKTVVTNLIKKRINAQFVPNRRDACAAVLEMIPPGALVARGDSISVDQIGVIPELQRRNQNAIIDPLERNTHHAVEQTQRCKQKRVSLGVCLIISIEEICVEIQKCSFSPPETPQETYDVTLR